MMSIMHCPKDRLISRGFDRHGVIIVDEACVSFPSFTTRSHNIIKERFFEVTDLIVGTGFSSLERNKACSEVPVSWEHPS
jgi:hypothetical protein